MGTPEITDENDNLAQESQIADMLRSDVRSAEPDSLNTENENVEEKEELTQSIIKRTNDRLILDLLSPEVAKNEEKRREHKDKLMDSIQSILKFQFFVIFLAISFSLGSIVGCHIGKIPFTNGTIKLIFAFVGAYITSVVVELIAILRFIVENVFDTSITGVLENISKK